MKFLLTWCFLFTACAHHIPPLHVQTGNGWRAEENKPGEWTTYSLNEPARLEAIASVCGKDFVCAERLQAVVTVTAIQRTPKPNK